MTLLVRGTALPVAQQRQSTLLELGSAPARVLDALDLSNTPRAGTARTIDIDAFDDKNTLFEIELDDGLKVWLRPSELSDSPYFKPETQRDGAVELVPTRLTERGAGTFAARILKVFKIDPVELAGGLGRDRLIAHLEREVREGLLQIGAGPGDLKPVRTATLTGKAPCLLLLHGTFSSTLGSFGGLQVANDEERWRRLSAAYGQRMLALEHRTLSLDPLQNALDLVRALPGGLHLHLLSHSRGGLIGELLCRRDGGRPGFSTQELALLAELEPALAERARQLDAVLREKAFVVERFVRVACPARGTTLASERGREWLTVTVNLLARLLKSGSSTLLCAGGASALVPMARRAVDLLEAITLNAIDTSEIPGLRAMDPASAFIRGLINAPPAQARDELAVIAGDTEGAGLLGRIKMFAVDRFFERDNDLVVDTASMTGGAQRERAYRFLARGSDISHITYFGHPHSSDIIVKALTTEALTQVPELATARIDQQPLRRGLRTPVSRDNRPNLPIVFLLPGIMGTHLKAGHRKVWVDKWELARGGFAQLDIAAPDVEIAELDGDTYQSLADALASDHEVVPFPYDWRLSIDSAARRLNESVRERLAGAKTHKRPIRFVAHSMGGLVVRAMMTLKDSVWPELDDLPDRRFVMLGTPNQGSHAISLLLTGNDKLVRLLAIADLKNSLHDIVGIAAAFPGALDMAPTTPDRDYFTRQAWRDLASAKVQPARWPLPEQAQLDASRAFRQRLDQQNLSQPDIFYIAGHAKDTPIAAELVSAVPRPRLKFLSTPRGDGRVPWETGIPEGVRTWYVPAKHGDIPAHRPLHGGLRDILASGTTQRLPDTPPRTRDLPGERHEYPEELVNYLPDGADFIAAAMHAQGEPEPVETEPLPPISVRVTWGNLRYARDPVVVGHYVGDQIVSAERALDTFLNGALSQRLSLGRYPGELGTSLVLPNPRGELPGAIVIGLGQVSMRLTRSDLVRAVQSGVCEWAARMLESRETNETAVSGDGRGLAFVAIGSGTGGMAIAEAGNAILSGVQSALELLRNQCGIQKVKALGLSLVHFLELYEDRAHTLWHGLSRRLNPSDGRPGPATCFVFGSAPDSFSSGVGGRRRLVLDELDDWWNPLKITQQGSRLVFESIGDRARAELHGVSTHTSQIDALLRQAIAGRHSSDTFANALFEMMIPHVLKDSLPSGERLRLLVDQSTARYPWELILSGQRTNGFALSAGNPGPSDSPGLGVIRQFATSRFRSSPRMSQQATALVIGDPETDGAFPPLPDARSEAEAVQDTLHELGFTLSAGVLRDYLPILTELYARPYQILHLAGHGIENLRDWLLAERRRLSSKRDDANPERSNHPTAADVLTLKEIEIILEELDPTPISAMVVGPRQFLTYRNIEQMSQVPELVFINCCHLGKIDRRDVTPLGNHGSTAANFAEKFIEIGVRAVIAAGWPVEDAAASTFATEFYRRIRAGAGFGDAVRGARESTRERHPDSNTWAAYQCYGDPSFRLTASKGYGAAHSGNTITQHYGSPRHLAWEGIQTVSDREQLEEHIDLAQELRFDEDGELCAEIAAKHRGLGAFDQAIDWYRRAIAAEPGDMPLRGIEQLANLIVRSQRVVASEGDKPSTTWLKQIDMCVALLESINHQAPSTERYNLIGSSYKRKAMALADGNQRAIALRKSAQAYQAAISLSGEKVGHYPYINLAVVLGAEHWTTANRDFKLPQEAMALARKLAPEPKPTGSFWEFVIPADLLMARLFVRHIQPSRNVEGRMLSIIKSAHERDKDAGKLDSVADQLRFMIDALSYAIKAQKDANSLRSALKRVLEDIERLKS